MTRLLVILGYGKKLSVKNGMFQITGSNGIKPSKIAPIDVDEILITSGGITITTKAISLAGEMGIPIYIVTSPRKPPLIISPVYMNKTVQTRRLQYKAIESKEGFEIVKCIISNKITNQMTTIKKLTQTRGEEHWKNQRRILEEKKRKIEKTVYDQNTWKQKLRHIEAEAARTYWNTISIIIGEKTGFKGRDPDSKDMINTSLNYLYSILYSRSHYQLVLAGLDPYGGIFHTDKSGRISLVYDFTDPLKPIIDHTLIENVRAGTKITVKEERIEEESKKQLILIFHEAMKKKVKIGGETTTSLEDAIRVLAFRLARMFYQPKACDLFNIKW